MQLASLKNRIRIALTTTIVDEWSLLSTTSGTSRPTERGVAFHLGWHLRPMIERSWDIDCEYNRSAMDLEAVVALEDVEGRGIPDLIVHHRGNLGPEHNLLLLELATDRISPDGAEFKRARALQQRFGYQYAGLLDLRLGIDGKLLAPHWQWSTLEEGPVDDSEVYTPEMLADVISRTSGA